MFFWSVKINEHNIKGFLFFIIFVSSASTLVICFKFNTQVVLLTRCLQGFFSTTVALVKLTIDNKFNPKRDMQKVIDMAGLWFFGLALGCSISGILSDASMKFVDRMPISVAFFKTYPFTLPGMINLLLSLLLMGFIYIFYPSPTLNNNKKPVHVRLYEKMQSTMFFQSVFFLSQNEFTKVITRHQRTRDTFDKVLLRRIIWSDRNMLFALIHHAIAYFVAFGIFEAFNLYCLSVLHIKNELFISIVYCAGLVCVYLFSLVSMDLDFFDYFQLGGEGRRASKDLLFTWFMALVSLAGLYLLRFISTLNSYFFLSMLTLVFGMFLISMAHILTINNYLIEKTSIHCGDDADHARNFAQFNACLMKIFGPFTIAMMASFNFTQTSNLYYDFTHPIALSVMLIILACMVAGCLDKNWKTPEQERDMHLRVKNGIESLTYGEVFA
mmetsp:Transcript_5304/g.4896  ORF Transcript_5304/g.4896 Transcript_5304/m.4896 type:complete len:441 (-) Transcript_5304:648-1970(-)